MSRILPCAACLVVITVSLTSGQQVVGNQEAGISRRQGLSRGAQNAEERGNLLQAQERDALSEQALLNREMRRQAVRDCYLLVIATVILLLYTIIANFV